MPNWAETDMAVVMPSRNVNGFMGLFLSHDPKENEGKKEYFGRTFLNDINEEKNDHGMSCLRISCDCAWSAYSCLIEGYPGTGDDGHRCPSLKEALDRNGPTVIRYPRGKVPTHPLPHSSTPPLVDSAARLAIWATGDWYGKACEVASRVGGIAVHARYLKPFDSELLAKQRAAGMKIVSLENGAVAGGFGEAIGADVKFGWPDAFIPHGTQAELEKKYGLDVDSIAEVLKNG